MRKAKIVKNGLGAGIILILFWLLFPAKDPVLPDSFRGKDVGIILAAISQKDREHLDYFFRELIERNPFGYVLLGEKPMSFDVFMHDISPLKFLWAKEVEEANESNNYRPTPFEKFVFYCGETVSSRRFKLIKGYKTWRKYEKFFPSNRFVFFYQNVSYTGSNDLRIALINKQAFVKKVNQHLDDFRVLLNREISGERLIQSENLNHVFNHHGLLGTLLGFGRDNAFLYHNESGLRTSQEKKLFREQNHFEFVWDKEEVRLTLDLANGLHSIDLPCFVADATSTETQALKMKYLAERTKIIDYYKNKDFLDATLRLLVSTIHN